MYRLLTVPHVRQVVAIVSGRCSRATDGQKPGTVSAANRARNVPRSERGVGGRGVVAVVEAVAGACYILHLRESTPRSGGFAVQRRSGGDFR